MENPRMRKEKQGLTCQNEKCKSVFASPILVENMALHARYYACPSCFTALKKALGKRRKKKVEPAADVMREVVNVQSIDQSVFRQNNEVGNCPHHFSYLGERAKGERIPDECMLCTKVMDCMRQQEA
jgi:hypothetical protein